MLAKEIKIKTMKKQREFIRKQLSKVHFRDDGDGAYKYVGHVYPEVIAYFESEGFTVTKVKSDMLTAMTKGVPMYLFIVGDIELTEDELKEAEAIEIKAENDDECTPSSFEEFMASIFGKD